MPVTSPNFLSSPRQVEQTTAVEQLVTERPGRIIFDRKTDWYVLRFEPADRLTDLPEHRIVPSHWLGRLEELADDGQTLFTISGESLLFNNQPYIFVRNAGVVSKPESRSAEPDQSAGDDQPPGENAGPAELTQVDSVDGGGITSQKLFERLLRARLARPIFAEIQIQRNPSVQVRSVAPQGRLAENPTDRGDMLIDRLGRLVPSADKAGWWELRLESDNTLQEQPLLVLPNLLLQRSYGIVGPIRVTGEVTNYKGMRYVLLRKVHAHRQMGQF